MAEKKPWYKSKTLIVGICQVVAGVIAYIEGQVGAGASLSIMGVVMVMLRIITKEPIK